MGSILMLAGLLAVRPSIAGDGFTDALTRLGIYAATIGATVGMITVILNGVAAKQLADHKQLADQLAAAPAGSRPRAWHGRGVGPTRSRRGGGPGEGT